MKRDSMACGLPACTLPGDIFNKPPAGMPRRRALTQRGWTALLRDVFTLWRRRLILDPPFSFQADGYYREKFIAFLLSPIGRLAHCLSLLLEWSCVWVDPSSLTWRLYDSNNTSAECSLYIQVTPTQNCYWPSCGKINKNKFNLLISLIASM